MDDGHAEQHCFGDDLGSAPAPARRPAVPHGNQHVDLRQYHAARSFIGDPAPVGRGAVARQFHHRGAGGQLRRIMVARFAVGKVLRMLAANERQDDVEHPPPRQGGIGGDAVGAVGQARDHSHLGGGRQLRGVLDVSEQCGQRARDRLDALGPEPIEAMARHTDAEAIARNDGGWFGGSKGRHGKIGFGHDHCVGPRTVKGQFSLRHGVSIRTLCRSAFYRTLPKVLAWERVCFLMHDAESCQSANGPATVIPTLNKMATGDTRGISRLK